MSHCQAGIEQQDTLLGPAHEVAVAWAFELRHTIAQLLVHVLETRWNGHTHSHAEAHSMSLVGAVVRILSYDYHLYLLKTHKSSIK